MAANIASEGGNNDMDDTFVIMLLSINVILWVNNLYDWREIVIIFPKNEIVGRNIVIASGSKILHLKKSCSPIRDAI